MQPLTKVTLKDGLQAGDFTDVGKVSNLGQCYDVCCQQDRWGILQQDRNSSDENLRTNFINNFGSFCNSWSIFKTATKFIGSSGFIFVSGVIWPSCLVRTASACNAKTSQCVSRLQPNHRFSTLKLLMWRQDPEKGNPLPLDQVQLLLFPSFIWTNIAHTLISVKLWLCEDFQNSFVRRCSKFINWS